MPLNSEDPGESSPQGSTPSMFGSISSLAGSGVKSLANSKAAHLGLRRGKALLSSAWTSLSPASTKNTKEALSSLRSNLSTAATNLSKRYEEMTASPAANLETSNDAEDRVSQSSNESRRQSEAVQVQVRNKSKLNNVNHLYLIDQFFQDQSSLVETFRSL